MGKRGPAPTSDQTAVLSTRITPEVRAMLEAARDASGKTLSREIQDRLKRTFYEDEKIADAFGSRRNYALMRLIASTIETIAGEERKTDWIDDPYLFDQVQKSVLSVLEGVRPAGDPGTRPSGQPAFTPRGVELGPWTAWNLLREVQLAGSELPVPAPKRKQRRLNHLLKADLGQVAERARTPFRDVTSEDLTDTQKGTGSKSKGGRK